MKISIKGTLVFCLSHLHDKEYVKITMLEFEMHFVISGLEDSEKLRIGILHLAGKSPRISLDSTQFNKAFPLLTTHTLPLKECNMTPAPFWM